MAKSGKPRSKADTILTKALTTERGVKFRTLVRPVIAQLRDQQKEIAAAIRVLENMK